MGSRTTGTTIHRISQSAALRTASTLAGFTGLRNVNVR